jgi:succinate dehydrogenase / fumarate reductase cytochrome b subunit
MERPLSPFMFPTWYRFQITSVLSITHRLTGIALAVGSILLAWWLVAVAAGGEVFAATHAFIASPVGVLLLFGWSVAFFYHLCSGIRHLAWDAGYGFARAALVPSDPVAHHDLPRLTPPHTARPTFGATIRHRIRRLSICRRWPSPLMTAEIPDHEDDEICRRAGIRRASRDRAGADSGAGAGRGAGQDRRNWGLPH